MPRRAAPPRAGKNAVSAAADLSIGRYGIPQPRGSERLSDDCENLVLFVPGVAFDRSGNRLGRGHGWYDRVLARFQGRAIAVGLAYAFQLVEDLPTDDWDRKVQFIVTENGIIDCLAGGACAPAVKYLQGRGCLH
jgi:5-formyltetrahydrofolate cyclo-ligase